MYAHRDLAPHTVVCIRDCLVQRAEAGANDLRYRDLGTHTLGMLRTERRQHSHLGKKLRILISYITVNLLSGPNVTHVFHECHDIGGIESSVDILGDGYLNRAHRLTGNERQKIEVL